MINLEQFIYEKVKPIFDSWDEPDIYAVSFFASSNEMNEYRGFGNVTEFAVSYNTERDCPGAGPHSEERWNYAFWRQNETSIFSSFMQSTETDVLFDWYEQQGIADIGHEDENMEAPVGYRELVEVLAKVARRFQEEGYWKKRFARNIPIIIHDLEYISCTLEATAYANPNGEAEDFLHGNWESCDGQWPATPAADPLLTSVMQMMEDAVKRFGMEGFMQRVQAAGLNTSRPDIEALRKLVYEEVE